MNANAQKVPVSDAQFQQQAAEVERLFNALNEFTQEMRAKLLLKVREGFTGWDHPANATDLYQQLLAHAAGVPLAKGQEVHIANFAMFLWFQRTGRAAVQARALKFTFVEPEPPRGVGEGDVGVQ